MPAARQRERILAYYRRDVGDPVAFSVHSHIDLGAFDAVARYYIDTLIGEIDGRGAIGDSGTTARHTVTIALDGEYVSAPRNYYGRAVLTVTYRTGPGLAIVAADSIVGPYRFSRLSRMDGLLNSLRGISPRTMVRVLYALQERAADEMGRNGLPYTIYWETDERPPHDLRAVLRTLGHPAGGESEEAEGYGWNLFEPPNTLAERMETILDGSAYRFVLEPLTGTIRFFYNSDT